MAFAYAWIKIPTPTIIILNPFYLDVDLDCVCRISEENICLLLTHSVVGPIQPLSIPEFRRLLDDLEPSKD